MIKIIISIIFISFSLLAREKGQTEITTEEGIEVFQKEKFYLLKKNVNIISDEYNLQADLVKAYFNKDLYDITRIESEGNVNFEFNNRSKGKGSILDFSIKKNIITILGKKSFLIYNNLKMESDQRIYINDTLGKFELKGKNSKLTSENIQIIGSDIGGNYETIDSTNEIIKLTVVDENISNIIDSDINMFAKKAIYSKKQNIIELFDNVKIIRNNEIVTGDYAKINTLDKSYKIISKNSNKVKLLIETSDE